jgi:hypothetical protein
VVPERLELEAACKGLVGGFGEQLSPANNPIYSTNSALLRF